MSAAVRPTLDELRRAPGLPRVAGHRRGRTVAYAVERALPHLTGSLAKHTTSLRYLVDGLPPLPADSSLPSGYAEVARPVPGLSGMGCLTLDHVTEQALDAHAEAIRRRVGITRLRSKVGRGAALACDPDAYGHGAYANFIEAIRWLWRLAIGLLHLTTKDPTGDLNPHRRPSTRVPSTLSQLGDIFRVFGRFSDDPILDTLVWECGLRTAARQEGLLNAVVASVDPDRPALHLAEKYGGIRDVPLPQPSYGCFGAPWPSAARYGPPTGCSASSTADR